MVWAATVPQLGYREFMESKIASGMIIDYPIDELFYSMFKTTRISAM